MATLAFVLLLGDQREFRVVDATPDDGATAPATLRTISMTFSNQARQGKVEDAFRVEPPVAGTPRWRGQTFEYVLTAPLEPGTYRVTLEAGDMGRAAEPLREPYAFAFEVREPGIAVVEATEDGAEALVEVRGEERRELARGERILDYAVSPDGSRVAVIIGSGPEQSRLELIDSAGGEPQVVVDSDDVDIATVRWAADSQALLAVRRDRLPDGGMGVPRAWLLRLSGEFVAPIDPDGEPTLSPVWSPDAQMIAYSAPATGRLVVLNLGTQERENLGQPRSTGFVWSPNSRMVAFEGVPETMEAGTPVQPVRVKSVDGSLDVTIGGDGASLSAPRFFDNDTVMSLRRAVGAGTPGTELVFNQVADGEEVGYIQLTDGPALVLTWDMDPTRRAIVFTTQEGSEIQTIVLDLETGERQEIEPAGRRASWLP